MKRLVRSRRPRRPYVDKSPFAKDVRFQSTKPRRSYKDREHEVIKVDVDSMAKDENRAIELEFAKHKARLKAQIMKDMVKDEGQRATASLT